MTPQAPAQGTPPEAPQEASQGRSQGRRLRRLLGLLISAGGVAILVNEAMLQVLR